MRGKLPFKRFLNLLDVFWARPKIHRRFESLITDRAESLAHSDVRAAAIFLIGLFAFGKKCDDLPYSASGDDQPAAEPGVIKSQNQVSQEVIFKNRPKYQFSARSYLSQTRALYVVL